MMKPAKKVKLDKVSHSVRASQAVLQYGVGAMVDFPSQTLMTAAPEFWEGEVVRIHDERLEKALKVDYFGIPKGENSQGISYARFPEWYFCPKCRKFQSIPDWISDYNKLNKKRAEQENDIYMVRHLRCAWCKQDLVPARIVVACECGHIDDFPWIKWVHSQNTYGELPVCSHPSLTFKTSPYSNEGLEGIMVSCGCGARATLKGAFGKDIFQSLDSKYDGAFDYRCTGRHPWKNEKESCKLYPRTLQRGSSAVYFPVTASSLVIPPYSSLITKCVENSKAYGNCMSYIANYREDCNDVNELRDFIAKQINKFTEKIAFEIGMSQEKVRPIIERKLLQPEEDEQYSTTGLKYRWEEYEALSGRVSISNQGEGDFLREETDISEYSIPFVNKISLIHKVREVQALIGFSRIKPVENENSIGDENMVPIKQPETNWYPAYEVRGEGIYLEFDEKSIYEWERNHPEIRLRVNILNENYQNSFMGQTKSKTVTAKFLLLHTISHALIKQLSFECGYSIASIKERIYCSDDVNRAMAGILIYTASGDSEGSLGGLVRQGRADIFSGVFRKAIESLVACSNDPICSLSKGQGRDSLNLSACYSCSLIPETGCEEYNVFLDRAVVVGTCTNHEIGFYHKQLQDRKLWQVSNLREQMLEKSAEGIKYEVVEFGLDLRDSDYSGIWKDLLNWAENEDEKKYLNALVRLGQSFASKEKPFKNTKFKCLENSSVFECDLFWKESNVAFFTKYNEDSYYVAKTCGIKCFITDSNFLSQELLDSLRG